MISWEGNFCTKMNYLADLILDFFRGQNKVLGIILFVVFILVYYVFPRPYSTVSCKGGKCIVLRGEKQLRVFNTEDVKSCSVASRIKYRRKARDRRYYYPVITLKDGKKVYLPSSIRAFNKNLIDGFCADINDGKDFTFQSR